ncbi:Pentatricopeptide repeat-containing protein At5g44230 [Linum grandiflorum]
MVSLSGSILPKQTTVFAPFSRFQEQRNLLESQLVSELDSCTSILQVNQVHARILRKGLNQSSYVITKLLRTLTKLHVPLGCYPLAIFAQVQYPNPFIYTAIIRGYSTRERLSEAVGFYGLMRRDRVVPVSFTFTALLKGCSGAQNAFLGEQLHAQTILIGGLDSDLHVRTSMIDTYLKCGQLACARKVFDEMQERDAVSWTGLTVAYSRQGDMESASELFDRSPAKDMVAWTAMVTGFAQNAMPKEAIDTFERMQKAGVETDEVTLIGVISACAQLGASEYADWVYDIARSSDFSTNHVILGSALVDMFSKCGNVDAAHQVFQGMKEKNVFSYTSMISGFATNGRPQAAVDLFNEMIKKDVKPNRVTFTALLTAYSYSGKVEEGKRTLETLKESFGIEPNADHYTCIVDVLGRTGRLEEAYELVKAMPIKPHGGVWGALLVASRIHGNTVIAEIAASHLFELEPDGTGTYILLCSTYAAAGKWDDVSRIRRMMRGKGLDKNPGYSWIEAEKGVIHKFVARDTTHPMSREIKQILEDLLNTMEANGYQQNLSSIPYSVSDEEKRSVLMTHSEKLALAFGLLSSEPGSTIRIMKNIRICDDCHLFMCGASKITRRKIVVRDNNRFHHFEDGNCSCEGLW